MMTSSRLMMAACGLCAMVLTGAAHAEAPQQTTATYDDWVLRCSGVPPQKSCEIVQFTQLQGQGAVLTQIAVGSPRRGDPLRAVIQVPIEAWLPTGVRILTNDKAPGLGAVFKRCTPAACFADVELRDDVVRRFRIASDAGKLQFRDSAQKDITLPVSFKGFGAALDALQRE